MKRRAYVPWAEFAELCLADYDGGCRPVTVCEHVPDGSIGTARLTLADDCGNVVTYKPTLDDDGQPSVRRVAERMNA